MRIGIWGGGAIGTGLVYRLATTPFTSELSWINRTYGRISHRVVDIQQGLGFAPTCRGVRAWSQDRAAAALQGLDILVLTLGAAVPKGKSREDVYTINRDLCRTSVIPVLASGFEGIVLVVTNPVDLIARLIQRETGLPREFSVSVRSSRPLACGPVSAPFCRLNVRLGRSGPMPSEPTTRVSCPWRCQGSEPV